MSHRYFTCFFFFIICLFKKRLKKCFDVLVYKRLFLFSVCSTYNKKSSETNNALEDLLEFELPKEETTSDKVYVLYTLFVINGMNMLNYNIICKKFIRILDTLILVS